MTLRFSNPLRRMKSITILTNGEKLAFQGHLLLGLEEFMGRFK